MVAMPRWRGGAGAATMAGGGGGLAIIPIELSIVGSSRDQNPWFGDSHVTRNICAGPRDANPAATASWPRIYLSMRKHYYRKFMAGAAAQQAQYQAQQAVRIPGQHGEAQPGARPSSETRPSFSLTEVLRKKRRQEAEAS